jgi:hypothetical protein
MMRKGSSRKGQRRRRAVSPVRENEGDEDFLLPQPDAPIKLDLSAAVAAKEIVRIETSIAREIPSQQRFPAEGEGSWGHHQAEKQPRRVWWSFAAVIVLMFAAIAWVNDRARMGDGTSRPIPQGIVVLEEDRREDSELFLLLQNPYQKHQQAQSLFRQFTAAKKSSEVLPLIRTSDGTDALLKQHWKPWPSPPVLDQLDQLQFDFDETDGRAFLSMRGRNADGSSFLAFFVADGGGLKLDWEATMELGEARLSTLARFPTENPVTLRVLLAASPYYLPSLPEKEYESYQLTCMHDDTVVWGYVRRASPEHEKIRELLRQDSELLEQVEEVRVTVRLKKTGDLSSQNRFFITEMLHKDWVMP